MFQSVVSECGEAKWSVLLRCRKRTYAITDYLNSKDLDPEAIDTIKQNRLSGATFLELSKEHLKELFPVVGDRIAVSKLLESLKVSSTHARTDYPKAQ